MSTPIAPDPDDTTIAAATDQPTTATPSEATGSPDPITGEPGAHPVGVGVGALSAGAAGAAIGSIGGPIGMLIGAAIGAVAGGLAGKEVASTVETTPVTNDAMEVTNAEEPPLTLPVDAPTPITMGAVPGEGFRASSGSGVAGDAGMLTTGTSAFSAVPETDVEDAALPTPIHAATAGSTGMQAPTVPETKPLAGVAMPGSGEEAVQVAAYYLYVDRSATGQPGDALGDWLTAEHEMMLG